MRPLPRSVVSLGCACWLALHAGLGVAQDQQDEQDELDDADSAREGAAEAGPDEPDDDGEVVDTQDGALDNADEGDGEVASLASWSMQLSAEVGVGMRNVDLPRDGLLFEASTGLFPALGVGFELDHHSSKSFSIGLTARYQSSIGLVLSEQLTDGTQHDRKTRAHQFELGLAPTLHLGDGAWAIYGALGYAISELDPENHLVTPSYHLGGPYLRLGLQLPLGSERVRLRLGPDGQLLFQIGDELRALGTTESGLGLGASAALEVRLGERWAVAATYREQRFWLGTSQGPSFVDASRFVTAQLKGAL